MTEEKQLGQKSFDDVRMRGFAQRTSVEAAQAWVNDHAAPLAGEFVPLQNAAGRVLAEDVRAGMDVPTFDRSMMDGFALQAEATHGATSFNMLPLLIVGQSYPGQPFPRQLQHGECIRIMTGAPMPAGANAVLPAEKASTSTENGREILHVQGDVAVGKHIGPRGEDVRSGELVLQSGRRLRPQDLGLAASIGISELCVVKRPRVRVIVTGNEVQGSGQTHKPQHIFDANGPMLTSLAQRDGAVVQSAGITPDDPQAILRAIQEGTSDDSKQSPEPADVILISGGSSVGAEDHAARLLAEHGELAIHGIAMRPSSPSGMGLLPRTDKPASALVFLLPGNPVSCLCAYDFFAGRAIRSLGGLPREWPYRKSRHKLTRKLVSQIGRVDYARVRLLPGDAFAEDQLPSRNDDSPQAIEPLVIGGASTLSSAVKADGFVIIPAPSEGYPASATVDMWRYDE